MKFATAISALLLAGMPSETQGLQMMLKSNDWYCMSVAADFSTVLNVDYLVTGINPEQVDFEARQDEKVLVGKHGDRSSQFEVNSGKNKDIDLCWRKKDRKSKKLDFSWKRNTAHSAEAADTSTLDSLTEDLKLLQEELEEISRNI